MANPQIENGYTRIAHEILEQISKVNLNGTQFRIVMVIWRYTYGFQKTSTEMSYSFIAEAIGIKSKSNIQRELNALINGKVINVVGRGPRGANILEFNKNYEEWSDCTPVRNNNDKQGVKEIKQVPNQKVKKNPTKKHTPKKVYNEDNTYYKMALYFFNKVSNVAKEAGVEHLVKKANLQKWADEFRKLIEIDGVTKRQAKDVMDWVTQDPFWKTNVLSARKLREKFTELAIKMNATNRQASSPKSHPFDTRDKEIAFQQWIMEGGDPNAFEW